MTLDGRESDVVTELSKTAKTELTRVAQNAAEALVFATVPLEGRAGKAQELAEAITFLVSRRASYITGDKLYVGGGWGTLAAI